MTFFSRQRLTYNFYSEFTFTAMLVILAIAFSFLAVSLYKCKAVNKDQQTVIEYLKSYCPEVKLGRSTVKSYAKEERKTSEGKVMQCIYDIQEHVILSENSRKIRRIK